MKRFFGFGSQSRAAGCPQPSVDHISGDVDRVSAEIESLSKQIRIDEQKCRQLDADIAEEIQSYARLERRHEDNGRRKDQTIDEIKCLSQHVVTLMRAIESSDSMADELEREMRRKEAEVDAQKRQFRSLLDQYRRQYNEKKKAYEEINQYLDVDGSGTGEREDDIALDSRRRQMRALRAEIQSLEARAAASQPKGLTEDQWRRCADPIAAIVEMATIKVKSMKMEEWIVRQLMVMEGLVSPQQSVSSDEQQIVGHQFQGGDSVSAAGKPGGATTVRSMAATDSQRALFGVQSLTIDSQKPIGNQSAIFGIQSLTIDSQASPDSARAIFGVHSLSADVKASESLLSTVFDTRSVASHLPKPMDSRNTLFGPQSSIASPPGGGICLFGGSESVAFGSRVGSPSGAFGSLFDLKSVASTSRALSPTDGSALFGGQFGAKSPTDGDDDQKSTNSFGFFGGKPTDGDDNDDNNNGFSFFS